MKKMNEDIKEPEVDPMAELKAGVKQMTDGGLVEAIEQTKITLGILKAELMSR